MKPGMLNRLLATSLAAVAICHGCANTASIGETGSVAFDPEDPRGHRKLLAAQGVQEELREPPVLEDVNPDPDITEVHVTTSYGDVELVKGHKTRMMLYNGVFPGPNLVAKEGDKVIFHVHNRTDEPTTTHFHGMIIEVEQDGAPWNMIPANTDHTYTWTAKKGFAMTSWYHAHAHALTHSQVNRGLAGPLNIIDPDDPLPPEQFQPHTIFLYDQKFDQNFQIPKNTEFDRFNGREGNVLFVNGQLFPKLTMRPGEIKRLRILNGSNARFYNLTIPGMDMIWVGTDGGLFEKPVVKNHHLLSIAERVEVLIKAPNEPGKTFTMMNMPYDRGLGNRDRAPLPLMTIEVAGDPVETPEIPSVLRRVEPLSQAGAVHRNFKLGTEDVIDAFGNTMKHFVINNKMFDPWRIDNVAKQGDTEIWTVENKQGNWDHPMHLHSVQFQVLDIDGVPEPFPAWKDTVLVPSGTRTRLIVRYAKDEFPGLFMFHCHILEHEDDGMMTHIFVNP